MLVPRHAVVTGTSTGLGAALVGALLDAGWRVTATSRIAPTASRPGLTRVRWDPADDDVTGLVDAVGASPVDLLVNNAGTGMPGTPLSALDVSALLAVIDVNVGGVLRAVKALQPALERAEAPLVLNISSRLASLSDQAAGAYRDLRTSYAYRVSKTAQNAATIALGTNWARTSA